MTTNQESGAALRVRVVEGNLAVEPVGEQELEGFAPTERITLAERVTVRPDDNGGFSMEGIMEQVRQQQLDEEPPEEPAEADIRRGCIPTVEGLAGSRGPDQNAGVVFMYCNNVGCGRCWAYWECGSGGDTCILRCWCLGG